MAFSPFFSYSFFLCTFSLIFWSTVSTFFLFSFFFLIPAWITHFVLHTLSCFFFTFTLACCRGSGGNVLLPIIDSHYIITAKQHDYHNVPEASLPSLVLFLVCTVALWWVNAQGRLDAGERVDAEEEDGNEDEKYEQKTGDERGREQLIAGEYAACRWRGRGRVVILAPGTGQNDEVARVGAFDLLELSR